MTDTALAITEPTRQARAVAGRSRPLKVTGKLKEAIDYMVFEGGKTDLQAAAAHAEMTTHSLRCALDRPHVKAYYAAQIEVLRTSQRARNIHRAIEIRDKAENMPAIHAIRYLDELPSDNHSTINGMPRTGGLTVVVVNQAAEPAQKHVQVIDNAEANN